MPISFACPGCGASLTVSDAAAGRAGKCPHCRGAIAVPGVTLLTAQAVMPAAALPASPPPPLAAIPIAHDYLPGSPLPDLRKRKDYRWLLYTGGAAAAGLLALSLLLLFLFRSGSSRALRYLPDDFQLYMVGHYDDVIHSKAYRELEKITQQLNQGKGRPGDAFNNPEFLNNAGVKTANIRLLTAAMSLGSPTMPLPDMVMVVETKEPLSAAEVAAALKKQNFTESKVAGHTVLSGTQDFMTMTVCVVDPRTVLFGINNTLRDALTRDRDAKISPGMHQVMKRVDASRKAFSMGLSFQELAAKAEFKQGVQAMSPQAAKIVTDLDMVLLDMHLADDVEMNVAVLCKSRATADELRKMTEGLLAMARLAMPAEVPPEVGQFLEAVKVSVDGNQLNGKATLKVDLLGKLAKLGQDPRFN